MDKFGIFKLLNSFFSFYGQKSQNQQENAFEQSEKNSDLFSNLVNNLVNKSSNTRPQPDTNTQHAQKPLQTDMLKTMSSHEEFIKRVKQKNT